MIFKLIMYNALTAYSYATGVILDQTKKSRTVYILEYLDQVLRFLNSIDLWDYDLLIVYYLDSTFGIRWIHCYINKKIS